MSLIRRETLNLERLQTLHTKTTRDEVEKSDTAHVSQRRDNCQDPSRPGEIMTYLQKMVYIAIHVNILAILLR